MYVAVIHRINDPQAVLSPSEGLGDASKAPSGLHPRQLCPTQAPPGVRARQFYPSKDLSTATCLLEADSIEAVRDYIESTLGASSENRYFEINAEYARGLPEPPRSPA